MAKVTRGSPKYREIPIEELRKISSVDELREKVKRRFDSEMLIWLLRFALLFTAVILGSWRNVWVGVSCGCLLGIIAGLYYINSTRYVRDAWRSLDRKRKTEDQQDSHLLELTRQVQWDYQEVDRNFGIACLTLSLITLGVTTVIAMR